jgi:hypothetical protein
MRKAAAPWSEEIAGMKDRRKSWDRRKRKGRHVRATF